jgi:hypothetical protein
MTNRRLPLHQELYLFAHDQRGTPVIHLPSLSVGLAGACLLDLGLAERLAVTGSRIVVQRISPVGDPVGDAILAALARQPGSRDLAYWLRTLAGHVHERTTGSLVAAGLLAHSTRRRARGGYQPVDLSHASVACARMRWAAYGHEHPDPQCAALCGLTAVLRLERGLHLDAPTGEVLTRLRELSRRHCAGGVEVVNAVEAIVGETAVSVYR